MVVVVESSSSSARQSHAFGDPASVQQVPVARNHQDFFVLASSLVQNLLHPMGHGHVFEQLRLEDAAKSIRGW